MTLTEPHRYQYALHLGDDIIASSSVRAELEALLWWGLRMPAGTGLVRSHYGRTNHDLATMSQRAQIVDRHGRKR